MEYVKMSCAKKTGTLYSFCSEVGWQGPPSEHIPRPYPDYERLPQFHYMHVTSTPREFERRPPDDFQPRANLKMFTENNIHTCRDDDETVKQFSNKFTVSENLVIENS